MTDCGHWYPEDGRLYAVLGDARLCAACWRAAGRTFPTAGATVTELHQAEAATRERMLARGGTDRHLVRDGHS